MRLGLFALLLLLSGGSLAQDAAPAADPIPEWVSVEANLPYAEYPETVLDILRSRQAPAGTRPVAIVIHGGGWVSGAKERIVARFCLPFLEKGWVVANVEYRLAKAAPAPAAVTDVLNAAAWVARNANRFNIDRRRVVVTGGSAGGHLALMVGLAPKSSGLGPVTRVAAVVNFYGITDVAEQLAGNGRRSYAVQWVPESAGQLELARRVSPLTYVRRDVPPVLTIHGDADPTVPYQHGARLTRALVAAGADAELIAVPGGGHGFSPETMQELWPRIFAWLEQRGVP